MMCAHFSPEATAKLADPKFVLRVFIEAEEKSIKAAREMLNREHASVMKEREKLHIFHQPMDASYWNQRYQDIRAREIALERAKKQLRELEEKQA